MSRTIILLNCHDDDVYCFRRELVEALLENNYRVVLSCPYGEKLEYFKQENVFIEDVNIDRRGTNPFKDIALLFSYIKLYNKYSPDMVLAFTIKPNIYGSLAARICRIKYVNNITGLGSGFSKKGIVKKIILFLYKCALKESNMVFFQNDENMKVANKLKLVNGKCQLIPGSGVNTDRFPLLNYPEGGNGIDGKEVVFNYIGRVLKDKGVDTYIEVAELIKKKYPNTEFNIIGFIEPTESAYKEKLELLEKRGIIHYCGQQFDIKPYLEKSHATIHPSMYGEGMSNVLLESASSGRVLITTINSGCRETVDNNYTGYIYDGSLKELYKKICIFLDTDNNIREQMGKLGRKKVKKEFSREYVVKAYLEVINEK